MNHPYVGLTATVPTYKLSGVIVAVGQEGSLNESESLDVVAILLLPDGTHKSWYLRDIVVDPKEAAIRLGAA